MKKGFTLIELLAVIVILAVLALIATPIVLNIIDDSKKNATLRSSENYIKAIEFSIAKSVMENKRLADGTYPIMSNGNICLGTLTGSACDNELIVEVSGETPENGTVTIKSRKIDSYEFTYKSGFVVVNGEINEGEVVCKYVSGPKNEIGGKYQCKVKDNMPAGYEGGYYFFILSKETDGTANLIMERNICDDGTVATKENLCSIEWISDEDYGCDDSDGYCAKEDKGPITAMNYLNRAISTWDNIDNLNITYNDEDENFSNFKVTGKARLPYLREVSHYDGSNGYLYNYLRVECEDWEAETCDESEIVSGVHEEGFEHIYDLYGYWTFSSDDESSDEFPGGNARNVFYSGSVGTDGPFMDGFDIGVRPVINVKLN